MRCARLVQSGEQSIDDANAAFRSDHEIGPAPGRDDVAMRIDAALESTHDRGAHRDHATAFGPRFAYAVRRSQRHLEPFFVRLFMRFEAGNARVKHELCDSNTSGSQAGEHRPREWP